MVMPDVAGAEEPEEPEEPGELPDEPGELETGDVLAMVD